MRALAAQKHSAGFIYALPLAAVMYCATCSTGFSKSAATY